ncbi:hypothetical protein [Streptomyces iconiensis]|uniref:Secreted protein n=1 Tax=Streptomyces iconiensis TaxID=1384038 RepID=A0ABT7A705_9ACTN|nr:hypothetical protein [Streptomyces iconiensis]MDJ1137108.1 hypothetical protein [Streptomyces iconiensis]
MEAIWTSGVAVAGTLIGVVVTHFFQLDAARRGERFARSEALWQERIATYSAFAAAAEEYRRGQAERWYGRQQDPQGEAFLRARDEAHRLRTVARQVLYRVDLVTEDTEVVRAAKHAYDRTRDMSTAGDQAGHDALDTLARQAIEDFVARASPLIR